MSPVCPAGTVSELTAGQQREPGGQVGDGQRERVGGRAEVADRRPERGRGHLAPA